MIFLDQVSPKVVILVKNGISEHHHWTLQIRISKGIKFQLKLTILTFFDQTRSKRSKTEFVQSKLENCSCACVHGCYLPYETFQHGGRQTQRYFNASSLSSRRDNLKFSKHRWSLAHFYDLLNNLWLVCLKIICNGRY